MSASAIGGVIVAAEPGDTAPSAHSVVITGGVAVDGTIQADQPRGGGSAAEKRTGVAVADAAGFSTINLASLGYDPEDFQLRIQVTTMGGGTGTLEAMGPAGTWTSIDATVFIEDDVIHLDQRWPEVRINWSGTGVATVAGYAA